MFFLSLTSSIHSSSISSHQMSYPFQKILSLHSWKNTNFEQLLYINLRPCQTCYSKNGGSAYSIGVGELGWQYGTGLKSHGTVTNWCTGREWPVYCMTVISARWRSNEPFQRRRKCIFRWPGMGGDWVGGELLYNWMRRKFNQLETRCGRESQHPAEGAFRPPINELEIRCSRENQHAERLGLRSPVEQPRTGKKRWWP